MFGKVMNWPYTMILLGFELCTDYSTDELKKIEKQIKNKKTNPRDLKAKLAREIVAFYYSKAEANKAEKEFNTIFRDKGIPKKMECVYIMQNVKYDLVELMSSAMLVKSKSEAKRLMQQGGVTLADKKITDWKKKIKLKNGQILRVGKRRFVKLRIRK
jgi:tyrosyl-tRNA synthetase